MEKEINKTFNRRYTGIQPQYFPRLHYFARILNADIFVIRDDAQFVRKHKYPTGKTGKSYQAHTLIKQAQGAQFLTVPTLHQGLMPIAKTKILSSNSWAKNHLKTLQHAYIKSPNFHDFYPEIEEILNLNHLYLSQLNILTILWGILHLLGTVKVTKDMLTIEFVENKLKDNNIFRLKNIKKASDASLFNVKKNLTANEKIVNLCKSVNANEDYCGGTGALAYMDKKIFNDNGIKVTIQDWKCKEYPQLFYKQQGFIPNLSIIDLLMNVPLSNAIEIIMGQRV